MTDICELRFCTVWQLTDRLCSISLFWSPQSASCALVIFLRLRSLLLLLQDCALSCCADAQLCCELSVRLRSEREISDIQRGERRTKGGGRCRGKSSCFSAPPPSTHSGEKNKPTYRASCGRCLQCSEGFGGERSSLELCSSLKDQPLSSPSHGLVWVPEMLLVRRCSWKWVWVLGALSATPPSAQQRPSVSLAWPNPQLFRQWPPRGGGGMSDTKWGF